MIKEERKERIEYLQGLLRNVLYEARLCMEEGRHWEALGFTGTAKLLMERGKALETNVRGIQQILEHLK